MRRFIDAATKIAGICEVPSCNDPHKARGYCAAHYVRWKRHGAALGEIPLKRFARLPITERFWSKVDQSGGPDSCWPWMRRRLPAGYGWFKAGGRQQVAHRVAYELDVGPIPAGLVVRHHCDNPPCCNPRHLGLGTHVDNRRDSDQRGRSAIGEHNGRAKLTADRVKAIRQLLHSGVNQDSIAAQFGVSDTLISNINCGRAWRHG